MVFFPAVNAWYDLKLSMRVINQHNNPFLVLATFKRACTGVQ